MRVVMHRSCSCGHEKDAHEHYRRGSDCSSCGCTRFHGLLELTVRFGRLQPQQAVVVPEDVPAVEEPWVRPTHSAGLTTYPQAPVTPPLPRSEEPVPARVTESTGG